MSGLTLEALVSMTPVVSDQDIVQLASRHVLLNHVKRQPQVHDAFFLSTRRQPTGNDDWSAEVTSLLEDATWFDSGRYAVLYAAQAICKLRDPYRIYAMLEEDVVEEQLKAMHESAAWKKIGFALYTTLFRFLVKDESTKVPFSVYIQKNPRSWARRLRERVRDPRWVHSQFSRDASDDVINRDVNIFFVKLHLLDPTAVLPAHNCLNKVVPDLSLELATTNYLGDPLQWTLIREDVMAALRKASCPGNVSMVSTEPVELYHGVQVCEFILCDCHEVGLWTGQYPDNRTMSHFRDRCSLM